MADLFGAAASEILRSRKISAKVGGLFIARNNGSASPFVTEAVDRLELDFGGILGDHHYGLTRKSGGREPWYPRGTIIRNERQVTLVCREELAQVARVMGIAKIEPEWIGANMVINDLRDLSLLPRGSLMFFAGGLTLKVDGLNTPCKLAGSSIARYINAVDETAVALAFVAAAKYLRGLTAWVEKPGTIALGEAVSVRIPEQQLYQVD